MTAEIRTEHRGGVAVLTVADPARRNALTPQLSAELADAVARCEADEGVGAVVVTGEPPAFCAGADLSVLGSKPDAAGVTSVYAGFLAVANCTLPTIAAVGGAAVGAGLNLALACDLRLVGPQARFQGRFLQLGIGPGGGMTWMLHRAAGPQAVAAMVLFGETVDAADAVRIGLAHRQVGGPAAADGAHDELVAAAVDYAEGAAQAPRWLVEETKRTVRATATLLEHDAAVERELGPQVDSLARPEVVERMTAARKR